MPDRACTVEGCTRQERCVGLCAAHYQRHLNGKDLSPPLVTKARGSLSERFWAKVDKGGPLPVYRPELGPCWLWTAACDHGGYGYLHIESRRGSPKTGAHRVAYKLLVGPIPDGLDIDHLCRVPACVRPSHLEPVTRSENTIRGLIARGRFRGSRQTGAGLCAMHNKSIVGIE